MRSLTYGFFQYYRTTTINTLTVQWCNNLTYSNTSCVISVISVCVATCSELLTHTMANAVASDSNIIQTFGKIFETKHKQDYANGTIKEEHLQQIAGRVTRGSIEADFEYLQKDKGAKKFAWVMGDDGLILFLKQSNI